MKTEQGNADSKWRNEKNMEGEESVRTVDCLRGRLLAERLASRNAKDEAEVLGLKLIELENLLKQEAKSRNRAEKKLKFLLKKLESKNLSYVTDESEHSGLVVDKTDISSVSSTASSRTQEKNSTTNKISSSCEESPKTKKKEGLENLEQINSGFILLSHSSDDNCSSEMPMESESQSNECPISLSDSEQSVAKDIIDEDSLNCDDSEMEKSSQLGFDQNCCDAPKINEQSIESSNEEDLNQEVDDQDPEFDHIDNSMALVLVDTPQKTQRIDPEVLDATVKKVLDALRHAREQIQSSMERRRRMNMIKVG